jgi:hypothetical protein
VNNVDERAQTWHPQAFAVEQMRLTIPCSLFYSRGFRSFLSRRIVEAYILPSVSSKLAHSSSIHTTHPSPVFLFNPVPLVDITCAIVSPLPLPSVTVKPTYTGAEVDSAAVVLPHPQFAVTCIVTQASANFDLSRQMTMNYPAAHTMTADNNFGVKRGTVPTATHSAMANTTAGNMASAYMAAQMSGLGDPVAAAGMPGQPPADPSMNAVVNQFGSLGINGHVGQNGVPGMMANPYAFTTPDGHIIFPAGYAPAGVSPYGYGQVPEPSPANFHGAYMQSMHPSLGMPFQLVGYPGRSGAMPERSDAGCKEVPGLDNRRSSYSTNESTPATPFLGNMAARDPTRIAVFDRSSYTTPSPQQITNGGISQPKGMYAIPLPVDRDLEALLKREPAIPAAVPAVFTPQENMKTLEQSLVNHIPGNRNVYIRGLHPTTDDDLLQKFAERFGKVETSKAIIDTATGACKG